MRTFDTFINFENTFESVPTVSATIKGMYQRVFRPTVKIIEEDCLTKIGLTTSIDPDVVGRVRVYDNTEITTNAYTQMVPPNSGYNGIVHLRSVSSCTSVGGICRRCLHANYEYIDPTWNTTRLTLVPGGYPDQSAIPVVGKTFRFDFTKQVTPFWSHLSRSYSGSILGSKSYLNDRLPLREGIYQQALSDQQVGMFVRAVEDSNIVNALDMQYAKSLNDPLEKVLFLLAQYSITYYMNKSV